MIIGGISAIIAKHKVSGKRRGKVPNRVIEERIKRKKKNIKEYGG